MSINFTSRTVPGDAQTKDSAGLVFGFCVSPFEDLSCNTTSLSAAALAALPPAPLATQLARCSSCGAYVSPYCKFTCDRTRVARSWMCYVCSHDNAPVPPRYADVANGTAHLAELKSPVLDFPLTLPDQQQQQKGELVFLFVVDLAGVTDDFVELQKNCLMAALEGVPRGSLIGLVGVAADSVFVFDLGAKTLATKQVIVPESTESRTYILGLEELLPLSRLFVPLGEEYEETLMQAVENLHRFATPPPSHRGFGTAVRMIVDYFAAYRDLKGARVGFFLGGRPNFGDGVLSSHRLMDIEPETSFYTEEAALADSVTFDLFCVGQEGETLGLASLKALVTRTGGVLINNVQPQDLFRLYKTPCAVNCEMVVRTSADVCISNDFKAGCSLATCSPNDTFSYDLEFTSSSGSYSEHVVVQVAFAYSVWTPSTGKLNRFLRIITGRAKTSLSWRMIYPSVLPEVQLTILAHKVARACLTDGAEQARLMLKKWLVKLMRLCEDNNVSLAVFANCKDLPRLVFALINSPLLRPLIAADDWAVAASSLARMHPRDVQTYLYPALSSWTTPDKLQSKGIHLNFAAVAATQCPLLLLDAFTTVIVKGAVPPKESALRAAVDKIRASRFAGPEVVFDTSGALFEKFMIESTHDYKAFMDEIHAMEKK